MATLLDPLIGLRIDGRRPNELRKIQCEIGVFAQADGSAVLSQGNTKVIATVYGPHEVKLTSKLDSNSVFKIKLFVVVVVVRTERDVRRVCTTRPCSIVSTVWRRLAAPSERIDLTATGKASR